MTTASTTAIGPSTTTLLLRATLVAVAYIIFSYVGRLFALPPSGASSVWPAAGLAVGALIVWGLRLWPGVWVGSLLYGLWLTRLANGEIAWPVEILIASGASLQALLGAWLTRRMLARQPPLTGANDVVYFLLLAGPLACLMSATLVVPGLTMMGHLPTASFSTHWLVWWAGDSIGVMLIAPLLIMLLPAFGAERRVRLLQVGVPLVIAGMLLVATQLFLDRSEESVERAKLQEHTVRLLDDAERRMATEVEALRGAERLFAASTSVSRGEFAAYAADITTRPGVEVVGWLPRVLPNERAAFETDLRRQGFADFRIRERRTDGKLIVAGARTEYFPVVFAETSKDSRIELGFDQASEGRRRSALAQARDSGQPAITEAVTLLTSRSGMVIFVPVYATGFDASAAVPSARRAALRGFVFSALDTESIFAGLVSEARQQNLIVRIVDITGGTQHELVAGDQLATLASPVMIAHEREFAGRKLRFEVSPTVAIWEHGASAPSRILLVTSVLAAFLVALAAVSAAIRNIVIGIKIEERTFELTHELAARREVEAALRVSEARFGHLFHSNPVAFSLRAVETGEVVDANQAFLDLIERSRVQVIGQTTQALGLWGNDLASRERLIAQIEEHGAVHDVQRTIITPSGRQVELSIDARLLNSNGQKCVLSIWSDVTQRNQATRALQAGEARLRSIIDNMAAFVGEMTLDGVLVDVNQTALNAAGLQREEVVGKQLEETWWFAHSPEVQARTREAIARAQSGKVVRFDLDVRMAGGSIIPIDFMLAPVRDNEGQVFKLIPSGIDIAERKRAEAELLALNTDLERRVMERAAALREQLALDSVMLENLTEGVATCDADGRLTLFNKTAREWLGDRSDLPPEQWAAHYSICAADGQTQMSTERLPLMRALRGEQVRNAELCIVTQGQAPRYVLASGGPIHDANGVLLGAMVAMHDITSVKQSQQRFQDLFEFTPDAIVMVNRAGFIVQVNRQVEALFGWQGDDLVGQSIEVLIPAEVRDRHAGLRNRYNVQPKARVMGSVGAQKGLRKDGTTFWVDVSLSPMQSSDGPLVAAAIRDISERLLQEEDRLARAVAEDANQAKSSFLAAMSHEIRTPMNAVLGLAEVLSYSKLSVHQADLVVTMRESAGLLLHLIDDILDFSKIEAGRVELEHTPLCVADLVESATGTLTTLAERKEVVLRLFVSPQIPTLIMGDETRLRQVIYNLLGNAIKFSAGRAEQPGHVTLRADLQMPDVLSAGAPSLRLTVADNGIGMTLETMRDLFTPFTQAERSTTRRFGGTGLGLTISKRIIDLMGGAIAVASAPGEGSTFTITLPIKLAPEQPLEAPMLLAGVQCFLVDGPAFVADDLQVYLEHAGAEVQQMRDLTSARAAAQGAANAVLIRAADEAVNSTSTVGVRQVLVGQGRRYRARQIDADTVGIDGGTIYRREWLQAVAIVMGRALPGIQSSTVESIVRAPIDVALARAEGRLILVAEDDTINQKVILQQLTLLGHAAEIAGDGTEALHLWRQGHYALLLTDLHMPEMDGYELSRTIRAEETARAVAGNRLARLPIIALTANALRGEESHARTAGIDAYLTKPISLDDLHCALTQWLPAVPDSDLVADVVLGSAADATSYEQPTSVLPSQIMDLSVLKRMVGDDPDTAHELLRDYLDVARQQGAQMSAAAANADYAHLAAIAHKLKSSSRMVGALALGDLCAELENTGKVGDHAALARHIREFERMHAQVDEKIAFILKERSL